MSRISIKRSIARLPRNMNIKVFDVQWRHLFFISMTINVIQCVLLVMLIIGLHF